MKTNYQAILWAARILCILAILFVSMFAADAFEDPSLTFWQHLLGFIIHLIPSFVLIGLLLIAWKWELIGGMVIVLFALCLTPLIFAMNYRMNHSVWISLSVIAMITFPFILTGGLFIVGHYLKKKQASSAPSPFHH